MTTAYVTCYRKDTSTDPAGDGGVEIGLRVDEADDRNQSWWLPDRRYLYLSMAVAPSAATGFEIGRTYRLDFTQEA